MVFKRLKREGSAAGGGGEQREIIIIGTYVQDEDGTVAECRHDFARAFGFSESQFVTVVAIRLCSITPVFDDPCSLQTRA